MLTSQLLHLTFFWVSSFCLVDPLLFPHDTYKNSLAKTRLITITRVKHKNKTIVWYFALHSRHSSHNNRTRILLYLKQYGNYDLFLKSCDHKFIRSLYLYTYSIILYFTISRYIININEWIHELKLNINIRKMLYPKTCMSLLCWLLTRYILIK